MESLIYSLVAFLGIHYFVSGTPLRQGIVNTVGDSVYRTGFAIVSLILLVWVVAAYAQAPYEFLWATPPWLRAVSIALIFLGSLFVAGGLTTKSPTMAGMESELEKDDPATGWLRITRHPLMAGIRLWALGHFILNGHTAAALLFISMFSLAAIGPFLIDQKIRQRLGDAWDRFAEKTSVLPFYAILQGRNHLSLVELGWHRLLLGVALFVALRYLHPWVAGLDIFAKP